MRASSWDRQKGNRAEGWQQEERNSVSWRHSAARIHSREAVARWWHSWLPDPFQQLRVCVSTQVDTKLQMVYAAALRSLTHTPARRIPLIVWWNYTRGVFSAFLTTKLLWRKPRSISSALRKVIKQQVNVNKAKETSSSCHCCGTGGKKEKKPVWCKILGRKKREGMNRGKGTIDVKIKRLLG